MNKEKRWWHDSVGYIIYPQSFKDSNHDGIGDIPGIVSKLDYLKNLGINLIWICPLFASPMDDNGYDVSDYRKINPLYGTMEDFQTLLKEAHERGIRILVDLVLNHTSDEHAWFQEALKDPNSPKRKYYYFKKGRYQNGKLLPPNNWKGFFSTSAWKQVEGSDDFYLHIFSEKMPDVNWECPELREEFYDIARFYLDMGVDGFRLDAVAHLAKDQSFADSDKPADENGLVMDTDKFSNREELYGYLQLLKENVFSHYDCLTVGEAGGGIQPEGALKMADREKGSINMVFNFDTSWCNGAFGSLDKEDKDIKTNVFDLKNAFVRWWNVCGSRCDMPLYWNNHDHPRCLSQYGSLQYREKSAKALITTLLFMYGTPFIFNGDEIGMSNADYENCEDFFSDVSVKNEVKSLREKGIPDAKIVAYLRRTARTNGHTPMQWENAPYAGFSDVGSLTKPVSNYLEGVNVKDELKDPYSILNFYQYAIWKRRNPSLSRIIQEGNFDILDSRHPDVLAYKHELEDERLVVITNMRDYDCYFGFYWTINDVILHNYGDTIFENHVFHLRPYETLVLKV